MEMASCEDFLGRAGVKGGLEVCVGCEKQEHCRPEEQLVGGLRLRACKANAKITGTIAVRLGIYEVMMTQSFLQAWAFNANFTQTAFMGVS